jgi:hypothetical protein
MLSLLILDKHIARGGVTGVVTSPSLTVVYWSLIKVKIHHKPWLKHIYHNEIYT